MKEKLDTRLYFCNPAFADNAKAHKRLNIAIDNWSATHKELYKNIWKQYFRLKGNHNGRVS